MDGGEDDACVACGEELAGRMLVLSDEEQLTGEEPVVYTAVFRPVVVKASRADCEQVDAAVEFILVLRGSGGEEGGEVEGGAVFLELRRWHSAFHVKGEMCRRDHRAMIVVEADWSRYRENK